MVVPADQQERVLQQRLELKVGLLRAQQVDAELGLAALDGLQDVVGREIEDADPDARVLRVEVLDDPRQEVVGRGRHRGNRHLPRGPVRQLADPEHSGIQLVQQPLRLEEEVPTDGAQPQLRGCRARSAARQARLRASGSGGSAPVATGAARRRPRGSCRARSRPRNRADPLRSSIMHTMHRSFRTLHCT